MMPALLSIAVGAKDAPEGKDERKTAIAEELLDAIKSGDADSVAESLEAFVQVCGYEKE